MTLYLFSPRTLKWKTIKKYCLSSHNSDSSNLKQKVGAACPQTTKKKKKVFPVALTGEVIYLSGIFGWSLVQIKCKLFRAKASAMKFTQHTNKCNIYQHRWHHHEAKLHLHIAVSLYWLDMAWVKQTFRTFGNSLLNSSLWAPWIVQTPSKSQW